MSNKKTSKKQSSSGSLRRNPANEQAHLAQTGGGASASMDGGSFATRGGGSFASMGGDVLVSSGVREAGGSVAKADSRILDSRGENSSWGGDTSKSSNLSSQSLSSRLSSYGEASLGAAVSGTIDRLGAMAANTISNTEEQYDVGVNVSVEQIANGSLSPSELASVGLSGNAEQRAYAAAAISDQQAQSSLRSGGGSSSSMSGVGGLNNRDVSSSTESSSTSGSSDGYLSALGNQGPSQSLNNSSFSFGVDSSSSRSEDSSRGTVFTTVEKQVRTSESGYDTAISSHSAEALVRDVELLRSAATEHSFKSGSKDFNALLSENLSVGQESSQGESVARARLSAVQGDPLRSFDTGAENSTSIGFDSSRVDSSSSTLSALSQDGGQVGLGSSYGVGESHGMSEGRTQGWGWSTASDVDAQVAHSLNMMQEVQSALRDPQMREMSRDSLLDLAMRPDISEAQALAALTLAQVREEAESAPSTTNLVSGDGTAIRLSDGSAVQVEGLSLAEQEVVGNLEALQKAFAQEAAAYAHAEKERSPEAQAALGDAVVASAVARSKLPPELQAVFERSPAHILADGRDSGGFRENATAEEVLALREMVKQEAYDASLSREATDTAAQVLAAGGISKLTPEQREGVGAHFHQLSVEAVGEELQQRLTGMTQAVKDGATDELRKLSGELSQYQLQQDETVRNLQSQLQDTVQSLGEQEAKVLSQIDGYLARQEAREVLSDVTSTAQAQYAATAVLGSSLVEKIPTSEKLEALAALTSASENIRNSITSGMDSVEKAQLAQALEGHYSSTIALREAAYALNGLSDPAIAASLEDMPVAERKEQAETLMRIGLSIHQELPGERTQGVHVALYEAAKAFENGDAEEFTEARDSAQKELGRLTNNLARETFHSMVPALSMLEAHKDVLQVDHIPAYGPQGNGISLGQFDDTGLREAAADEVSNAAILREFVNETSGQEASLETAFENLDKARDANNKSLLSPVELVQLLERDIGDDMDSGSEPELDMGGD